MNKFMYLYCTQKLGYKKFDGGLKEEYEQFAGIDLFFAVRVRGWLGGWGSGAGIVWHERENSPAVVRVYMGVCLMHVLSGRNSAQKRGVGKNSLDSLYLVLWSKLFKNFITESYIAPFSLSSECSEKMLFLSLARRSPFKAWGMFENYIYARIPRRARVASGLTRPKGGGGLEKHREAAARAAIIMNNLFGINLYIFLAHAVAC